MQPNLVRPPKVSNSVVKGLICDDVVRTDAARISDQQYRSEADAWEAPFERWLRMADDLLRDWPATNSNSRRRKI